LPLMQAGLKFFAALSVVFAADTLSIATMEIVDNLVMAAIPGAMDAGLVNPIFWLGMIVALTAAFVVAFPVNRYLIDKGKGHALTHQFHEGHDDHSGHNDPSDQATDHRSHVAHDSTHHVHTPLDKQAHSGSSNHGAAAREQASHSKHRR
ncbi:MAG TPA: DUF4396 domain-containing protein, partial [Nocardioidaceae bacterium]|nr:DUF4396 domain-containing protein [Nocardioidaceae bacterium]